MRGTAFALSRAMKKLLIIMLALGFTGCASLRRQVFDKVHEGDDQQVVLTAFGQPEQFSPSKDGTGQEWYYTRRGDLCGFFIRDGKVKEMGCWNRPGYIHPVAALFGGIMTGASSGASEKSSRSLSCMTLRNGDIATTHCD